ncbi:hypothetical protein [Fusibacter sp. JL216-2]|uniref:hypothetical protein n=1 Tax=Fusibacter sp. JL216-2 TaxID=3071453 RepID=UPI003D3514D8
MTDFRGNLSCVDSKEFTQIEVWLSGKELSRNNCLNTMKRLGATTNEENSKTRRTDYYVLSDTKAWEYFKKTYPKALETRRVRNMDDLKHTVFVKNVQ